MAIEQTGINYDIESNKRDVASGELSLSRLPWNSLEAQNAIYSNWTKFSHKSFIKGRQVVIVKVEGFNVLIYIPAIHIVIKKEYVRKVHVWNEAWTDSAASNNQPCGARE